MIVEMNWSFAFCFIGIPIGIFLIVLGFREKKKNDADRFRATGRKKGISSLKRGRADEFIADYFDYFLMLLGVAFILFGIAAILEEFFGEDFYSGLLLDVLFILIALSVFIICFFLNMMGKREDREVFNGVVVETYLVNAYQRRKRYRVILKYQLDGKDKFHKVAYSFSKNKVPDINDEIRIIYSRKYEKALTKMERGKYRLIMFGAITLAIVMGDVFVSTLCDLIKYKV